MVGPRTPVLVGAGVAHQRSDDPAEALEAVDLMVTAVERAGDDAQAPGLLEQARVVFVPRGTWRYRDPGRIVAESVGANARTVVAELGVLQSTPFTRACRAIANGDLDVALVVGGEAKFRDLRSHITGVAVDDTLQADDVAPDERIVPADEIIPGPERAAGFMSAPLMYSAVETALRTAVGETVTENAHATAELWAGFSRTAAENPDAWRRDPVAPELLEHPSTRRRGSCSAPAPRPTAPAFRRTVACTRSRSPSRTTCSRCRSAPSCTGRRPSASVPSGSRTSPAATSPRAAWSTSTAASPSPCASRRGSSGSPSTTPTAAPSAWAAA
jgi:acetyl-CoA acetyltransferase